MLERRTTRPRRPRPRPDTGVTTSSSPTAARRTAGSGPDLRRAARRRGHHGGRRHLRRPCRRPLRLPRYARGEPIGIPATAARVEMPIIDIWRVEDDLLVEHWDELQPYWRCFGEIGALPQAAAEARHDHVVRIAALSRFRYRLIFGTTCSAPRAPSALARVERPCACDHHGNVHRYVTANADPGEWSVPRPHPPPSPLRGPWAEVAVRAARSPLVCCWPGWRYLRAISAPINRRLTVAAEAGNVQQRACVATSSGSDDHHEEPRPCRASLWPRYAYALDLKSTGSCPTQVLRCDPPRL